MVKIPSALKWMMNRRARLLGEIKKVEKRFEARESALQKELNRVESRAQTLRSRLLRVQNLRPQHLAVLQQNLAAIDNAMGQHDVMIDTDLIRPLKGQDNAWLLPHGAMSRFILRALREADGEILCTNEVALFVAEEGKLSIDPEDFRSFKIAIRRRMRALHVAGLLKRVEAGRKRSDSRWRALRPAEQPRRPEIEQFPGSP